MTPIGAVHTAFAFIAIGIGAIVLRAGKGTRWHRTFGHLYSSAMIGTIVTAFLMYELTGAFGPFHFGAIVGGFTLGGGLYTVLARRPRKDWIEAHATWMSWSYIGLMAAFAAETLTRFAMPRLAPFLTQANVWAVFWTSVSVASFGIFGIGWWLVKTRLPDAVRGTPAAMRRERRALEAATGATEGAAEGATG